MKLTLKCCPSCMVFSNMTLKYYEDDKVHCKSCGWKGKREDLKTLAFGEKEK